MVNGFLENLGKFEIGEKEVNSLSPLVLAYIGDIVYEVYIRTMLVGRFNISAHKLHVKAINYVSATAQAEITRNIISRLTEEEQIVLKRGRNAKSSTIPKNASMIDYKYATGFESLIGFLYLKKNFIRLNQIIELSICSIDRKE